MQTRFRIMGALVCALSLFVSNRAEASYNYSSLFSISSPNPSVVIAAIPGGFTATLDSVVVTFLNQGGNKAVPSVNSLNLGDISVVAGTTAQTFAIDFTDTIQITNSPPPGTTLPTGTLAFSGTIGLVNVSNTTGTVLAANLAVTTGSTTAGGNSFVLSGPSFSSPTVNGNGGNVSALITSSAPSTIPEPASIVMLGLGMGALGVVRLRHRFLAA